MSDKETSVIGAEDETDLAIHSGWVEGAALPLPVVSTEADREAEKVTLEPLHLRIGKSPTDIIFDPGVHFALYDLHAFGYLFVVAASETAGTGSLISIGAGATIAFAGAGTAAVCRIVSRDTPQFISDLPLYGMAAAHFSLACFNYAAGDVLHGTMALSFSIGDALAPATIRNVRERAGRWIISDIDKIEGPAQEFRRSAIGTVACAAVNPITYFCSGIACSTYLAMDENGFWSPSSLVIAPLAGVVLINGRNALIQAQRSLMFAPNNMAPMYLLAGITAGVGSIAISQHPHYLDSMGEYFTPISQALESRDMIDTELAKDVYHGGMATVPFLAVAAYVVIQGRYLGGLKQGIKDLFTWDNKAGLPAPETGPELS